MLVVSEGRKGQTEEKMIWTIFVGRWQFDYYFITYYYYYCVLNLCVD